MSRPPFIALLSLLCACASDASEPASRSGGVWQVPLQAAEAPGDAVVASVNGVSVHASCVANQAKAHNLDRKEALGECVDFELLAQAAHAGGFEADPGVQLVAKQELVRSFTASRYGIHGPEDIPADTVRLLWEQIKTPRYVRPELRNIAYCRIPLTAEQGPDSEEYKIAEKFLTSVYEQLRDRRDLTKEDLYEPCWETYENAGVHEMLLQFTGFLPEQRFQEQFRPVYFGLEQKGMLAPPMHSHYGWDLPIVTAIAPELDSTFEEAEAELREVLFAMPVYEVSRDELFVAWYAPFAKLRKITVHPDRLPASAPIVGSSTAPEGAPTP